MGVSTSPRHPASPRTRGAVAWAPVAALVVLVSTLTGCSSDVEIDAPSLDAATERACATFLDDLPTSLAEQDPREVTPAGAPGRAWGDPAIVLTCGVGAPEGFNAFSECLQVNDVGWFALDSEIRDDDADVTFTAVGYEPRISLLVPPDYRPAGVAAALAELAEPVTTGLELVKPCV